MTYEELKDSKYVLFKSIRGSHLYGLETPESDIDTYSVFCCPQDWLYGTGLRYSRIIGDAKNDNVISELTKYFTELGKSNPDALISLFTPEDKIIYKNPILQPLFDIRESLLTKQCFKSFKGYARSQIGKAKGLNKAMNIDPDEVKERKTPLEFCWVHKDSSEDVWTLEKWLRENGLKQEHCGLVRLPNGIEFYVLYYDWFADKTLRVEDYARLRYGVEDFESAVRLGLYYQSENGESYPVSYLQKELDEGKKTTMIKYRGILDPSSPDSFQLRLSSISKKDAKESLICFQYNANAFSSHCRKYKEYHDWVKHRNPKRYETNLGHSYDSKNCSHCLRLLTMAKEIASGEGMILDRRITGDRDLLLDIKTHKYSYSEVMGMILEAEKSMEEAFKESDLPEEPDLNLLEDILIKIRHDFYDTQENLINTSQVKSLSPEISKMVDERFWDLT